VAGEDGRGEDAFWPVLLTPARLSLLRRLATNLHRVSATPARPLFVLVPAFISLPPSCQQIPRSSQSKCALVKSGMDLPELPMPIGRAGAAQEGEWAGRALVLLWLWWLILPSKASSRPSVHI